MFFPSGVREKSEGTALLVPRGVERLDFWLWGWGELKRTSHALGLLVSYLFF